MTGEDENKQDTEGERCGCVGGATSGEVAKEGGYTLLQGLLVPVPMFLQTKGSHMAVMFCSGDINNDCLEMLFLGETGDS